MPSISSSEKDPNEMLKQISLEGLKDKFNLVFNIDPMAIENDENYLEYKKRLDHEYE